jgi:hypothetical protein
MDPKVAILGVGPSAAFAFKACMDYGLTPDEVAVYGTSVPPHFVSAPVFFHDVPDTIKELVSRDTVGYVTTGTPQEYMRKQWGDELVEAPSSFPEAPHSVPAYDPTKVLPLLWAGSVTYLINEPMKRHDVTRVADHYPLVLQTFPIWDGVPRNWERRYVAHVHDSIHPDQWLLDNGHSVWSNGTLGFFAYCGLQEPHTRVAILNRVLWHEYSNLDAVPTNIKRDCSVYPFVDIHPYENRIAEPQADNIVLLGRSATWDRKMLAHHAYSMTCTVLSERTI